VNTKRYFLAVLSSLLLVVGCIVGDELTTITIHPDGSADMVTFRGNLHSTQPGPDGEHELADYKASFEARSQDDLVRIRDAGGTIVTASWARDVAPFSNVVRVRFPDAAAFEKYGKNDGSLQISTKWQTDGRRRGILIHVTTRPNDIDLSELAVASVEKLRQRMASGVSEIRIAVAGGRITDAIGFTVADDKQSALLDTNEIAKLLKANAGKAELHLNWEVAE
jgi:hypothetical protein